MRTFTSHITTTPEGRVYGRAHFEPEGPDGPSWSVTVSVEIDAPGTTPLDQLQRELLEAARARLQACLASGAPE